MNTRSEILLAKHDLAASNEITQVERSLLDQVSPEVNAADDMYGDDATHYLSVGLSAIRCIKAALLFSGATPDPETILDMPSGHGRVLRFLVAQFPTARISAVDVSHEALRFCRDTFSVETCESNQTFTGMDLQHKFELIWCGSLVTHLNEMSSVNLLRFLYAHLSDRGVCIVTTHGQRTIDWIESGRFNYGLDVDSQTRLIDQFNLGQFAYEDYPQQSGYGISTVSRSRFLEIALEAGDWSNTLFLEHGWDDHQDVYAFASPSLDVS